MSPKPSVPLRLLFLVALSGMAVAACSDPDPEEPEESTSEDDTPDSDETEEHERVDSRPPPMHRPVDLWKDGAVVRQIDAATAAEHGHVLLDLGDDWTPYLFTERDNEESEVFPNAYRATYLALAHGEYPDDHHGRRARRDKYLELYGILPTLGLLRTRLDHVKNLACAEGLELGPLEEFDGFIAYQTNNRARSAVRRFGTAETQVQALLQREGVEDSDDLDEASLNVRERGQLRDYRRDRPKVLAIRAAQDRLECEGFFEGKGQYTRGALDWATHEALAEFERRHRVYGWGFIGRDTLHALRRGPFDNEREAVLRVLTERAMHAAGVIEDGSAPGRDDQPASYVGADGESKELPNLEMQLRDGIIQAFGLQTPEDTLSFLEELGELDGERLVAIEGPELPEYYASDMDLSIVVDRGDVWYDFPYDEEGNEIAQPVGRRPRLSVVTEYEGRRITLARFGTTIGGWRGDSVEGTVMWKYKNSPVGRRIWSQIVASPVWMPPESSPPRGLLSRNPSGRGGKPYRVNLHEMGPSYASAYGLVAAYHRLYAQNEDGTYRLRGDEGIRTHGSVDYMSIMRRHSHGCHRMHNHLAVRLMSFVLAHRPHRRAGQQDIAFSRTIEYEDESYHFNLEQGGYVFELAEPMFTNVLQGRIRGQVRSPIDHPVPKYDSEVGAYITPEGQAVAVDRWGNTTPIEMPDAGVDGSVLEAPIDPFSLPLPGGPPAVTVPVPPSAEAAPLPSTGTPVPPPSSPSPTGTTDPAP